eukprot:scaffold153480_cov21-Tisochrysis_lutea.AAC.1
MTNRACEYGIGQPYVYVMQGLSAVHEWSLRYAVHAPFGMWGMHRPHGMRRMHGPVQCRFLHTHTVFAPPRNNSLAQDPRNVHSIDSTHFSLVFGPLALHAARSMAAQPSLCLLPSTKSPTGSFTDYT